MNQEKIEELKSKRLQLQETVRLQNIRKRVATQISHLEIFGEPYAVYYKFEHLNWIDSNVRVRNRNGYNGIHGDFQIDVDDSTAISSYDISENEINSEKFKSQFSSIIPTDIRLIICYQGGDPELEISVNAFLNNPLEFFSRPETWILTNDKKWIIEYICDQHIIRFIQLQASTPTLVIKINITE